MTSRQQNFAQRLKIKPAKLQLTWLLCGLLPIAVFATSVRKPAALKNEVTRYYSHIHWHAQPGSAYSVKLEPTINYTGKSTYQVGSLIGKEHQAEVRTVPDVLNALVEQLINNSNFLTVVDQKPQYFAQVHIRGFDTLYAPSDGNHWLNFGFAHIDRSWSLINGDNKPAKVALNLVIYDKQRKPILEVPVVSEMTSCDRSEHPMTFGVSPYQTFFDGYATTAIGQSFIAAINRALTEVSLFFKNKPIQGSVIRVDQNDIYVNLGEQIVSINERFDLWYSNDPELPAYPISRLEVEKTWPNMALVNALDVKSANVLPGDRIALKKPMQQRKFDSVAGKPIICSDHRHTNVAKTW